jgi:hypothetical protein
LKDIAALWVSMSAGIPTFMLGDRGDVVPIFLVPNLAQRASHKSMGEIMNDSLSETDHLLERLQSGIGAMP